MEGEKEKIVCHFDGSCAVNPGGEMGFGAVITRGKETIFSHTSSVPAAEGNTNNVAEYLALEFILDYIIENNLVDEKIEIVGDSQLVIKQISGSWTIKNKPLAYIPYARRCLEKAVNIRDVRFRWVPRHENTICDDLSKESTQKPNKPKSVQSEEFKVKNHLKNLHNSALELGGVDFASSVMQVYLDYKKAN